jgi:Protein of unknown function (DUF3306)
VKDENFLSRWSRRKIEAKGEPGGVPGEQPAEIPARDAPVTDAATAEPVAPLPELGSLSSGSDFAPFMRSDVDPGTRQEALRTLFADASLYPVDGLDVYMDDYSLPDPLPEGWLGKLEQFTRLHAPRAPEPGSGVAAAAAADPETSGEVAAPGAQAPREGTGEASASDTSDTGHSPTESR